MKKHGRKQMLETRLSNLFKCIYDDIVSSPQSGTPASIRMLERMRKKAAYDRKDLESEAYHQFVEINDLVANQNRVHFSGVPLIEDMREFITHILERAVRSFDPTSIQECFSQSFVLSNWRFGPGASNGTKGEGTPAKIDQPMTCTRRLEPLVRLLRVTNPYFSARDARNGDDGVRRVEGSRIKAVPKNEDSVRIIAIEPSGNMALQLGAGRLIELALRLAGLDIRTQQEKNRSLARLYSMNGGGATIDLSKASDMFSISLIRDTWPAEWYDFFMKSRCPVTELPDGRKVELSMMSTMGNGFTFPMMTLTLLALVYAVRRSKSGPYKFIDLRGTGVFGDDIIVPIDDFDDVVAAIEFCGLKVNRLKSFADGPFRESCGGDFHDGLDITPVYVKSLASVPDVYVAINQLLRWSVDHGCYLYRALAYLRSLLHRRPFFVPQWLGDSQGVRVIEVSRDYRYLKQVPHEVAYEGDFSVPLICGGYVSQREDGSLFYTTRIHGSGKQQTRRARLPRGYLDGWDPRYRTLKASASIQLLAELTLN